MNKKNRILNICVDAQFDFTCGSLGSEKAIKAMETARKVLPYMKEYNHILTFDTHFEDYMHTREGSMLPIEHTIKDTVGWNLTPMIDSFYKDEDNINGKVERIEKHTFGAYNIADVINKLYPNEKPERIVMWGLDTDICVISNFAIVRAFFPEIDIIILEDACAGVTEESHNAAITTLKSMQAIVMTVEEYIQKYCN